MRVLLLTFVCGLTSGCSLFYENRMMVSAICNDGITRAIFLDIRELSREEKNVMAIRMENELCRLDGGIFKLHSRLEY